MDPATLAIMRLKLHWLDGFAAGCDKPMIQKWVEDFRRLLNKIEAGEQESKVDIERSQ